MSPMNRRVALVGLVGVLAAALVGCTLGRGPVGAVEQQIGAPVQVVLEDETAAGHIYLFRYRREQQCGFGFLLRNGSPEPSPCSAAR